VQICSFFPRFQERDSISVRNLHCILLLHITHSSKVNCTLDKVNCTFCVRKHTILGPGKNYTICNYSKYTTTTAACSADSVTVYSCSVTIPSSPRSNEPALTSSRQPADPVYSRTLDVVAAFGSTIADARSRRRSVVQTTVVILDCPRLTADD